MAYTDTRESTTSHRFRSQTKQCVSFPQSISPGRGGAFYIHDSFALFNDEVYFNPSDYISVENDFFINVAQMLGLNMVAFDKSPLLDFKMDTNNRPMLWAIWGSYDVV